MCGFRLQNSVRPPTVEAKQPAEKTACSSCGAVNATHYRYCLTCGTPLKSESAKKVGGLTGESPQSLASQPASDHAEHAKHPMSKTVGVQGDLAIVGAHAENKKDAEGNKPQPRNTDPVPGAPARPVVSGASNAAQNAVGATAKTPRNCERCGAKADVGAVFCRICGAPLPREARPSTANMLADIRGSDPRSNEAKLGVTQVDPPRAAGAVTARPKTAAGIAQPTPKIQGQQPTHPMATSESIGVPAQAAPSVATPSVAALSLPAAQPALVSPHPPSPSGFQAPANSTQASMHYAPIPQTPAALDHAVETTSGPTVAPPPSVSTSGTGPMPRAPSVHDRATTAPVGRVVVIARDGSEGPSHPLFERLAIGRTLGEIQFPGDLSISPEHLVLLVRGNRVFLRDLESINGIYMRLGTGPNRPGSYELHDQSLFLIGQQVLRFEWLDHQQVITPLIEETTVHFGTPITARYARLRLRSPEGVSLDTFYLRKKEIVLGRETGDIVFTDDPFLSRRHSKLVIDLEPSGDHAHAKHGHGEHARTVRLVDLASSNGTFVRLGVREIEVYHGDQFRIGQQLLRIDLNMEAPPMNDAQANGHTRADG
jgi:pSer/pThr/pTyr-binding forkhead associated (FHA) protein/predicted amidophosphoribosyltransferase